MKPEESTDLEYDELSDNQKKTLEFAQSNNDGSAQCFLGLLLRIFPIASMASSGLHMPLVGSFVNLCTPIPPTLARTPNNGVSGY